MRVVITDESSQFRKTTLVSTVTKETAKFFKRDDGEMLFKFKGKVTEGTVASMGLVEGSVMAMIEKPKARGLNPDLEAMMERCNVEAPWAGQGETSPAGFRNPNVNWGVSKMVERGKKGERPCSFCAHPNAKKVCSRCSQTRYCDQKCQLQHWKRGGHKKECKKVEKDAWKYGVVVGGGGLVGGGGG